MDGVQTANVFLGKNKEPLTIKTPGPFDWSITPARECIVKERFECEVDTTAGIQLQVCGADGNNYDSVCEAARAGVEIAFKRPCSSCNPESGEVCGSDNETYKSECLLPTGVTKKSDGACALTHVAIKEAED